MYVITIYGSGGQHSPVVLNNIQPGQSLLEVCLNHDINLPHNCGGVCSCTTCHIYIEEGGKFLEERTQREKDFLKKAVDRKTNSRLSCQCLILEDRGKIAITIPEQTGY